MLLTTPAELQSLRQEATTKGQSIGWTGRCFDIMHPGHIANFEYLKSECDIVVVGLNADSSPYFASKPGRPINSEDFRARMLLALQSVDYVYVFDTDTPVDAIAALQPDLCLKGGDYQLEDLPEYPIVAAYGGKFVIHPIVGEYSTSAVIRKILTTYSV